MSPGRHLRPCSSCPAKLLLLLFWRREKMEEHIHSHPTPASCPTTWTVPADECQQGAAPKPRCQLQSFLKALPTISKGSLIMDFQAKRSHRLKHHLHLGGPASGAGANGSGTAARGPVPEGEALAFAMGLCSTRHSTGLSGLCPRGNPTARSCTAATAMSHASQGFSAAPCALRHCPRAELSWGNAECRWGGGSAPLPLRTSVGMDPARPAPDGAKSGQGSPARASARFSPRLRRLPALGWEVRGEEFLFPRILNCCYFTYPRLHWAVCSQLALSALWQSAATGNSVRSAFLFSLRLGSSWTLKSLPWRDPEAGAATTTTDPGLPHFGNAC